MGLKILLKKKFLQVVVLGSLGLVFLYLLFDWSIGAVIHARKTVLVPDLKGTTLSDAITQVSALNLGIRKEGEEFNQAVPAGTIVRQNPPAGMPVRENKIVRVTLSQGGQMLVVPSVTGQPARSAEVALRSAGFTLGEAAQRYSAVVPRDYVIEQDPPGAATVGKDDVMVNLVISRGLPPPGVCLAPTFIGKTAADAEQWARQNNMGIAVKQDPSNTAPPGTIFRQVPAPDADCAGVTDLVVYVAGSAGPAAASGGKTFNYEIPQGGSSRSLRLVLRDDEGETEVFKGVREPGTKLSVPVTPHGRARMRIFVNNILVEERELP